MRRHLNVTFEIDPTTETTRVRGDAVDARVIEDRIGYLFKSTEVVFVEDYDERKE